MILEQETYLIRGAVFEVYHELGSGFLEAVYQECLEKELHLRGIPYSAKQPLALSYKGEPLKQVYVPDLICFEAVIVEIKACKEIAPEHKAQLLNYLKASNMKVGLLVNFGSHPKAQVERFIM